MEKKKFLALVSILLLVLSVQTIKLLKTDITTSNKTFSSLESLITSNKKTRLVVSYESNCCEKKKAYNSAFKERMRNEAKSSGQHFLYYDLSIIKEKDRLKIIDFLKDRGITELPSSIVLDKNELTILYDKLVL